MRSSNYKHSTKTAERRNRRNTRKNTRKKASKLSSIIITVFVLLAVAVPSVALIQNAEALTDSRKAAFSIGDANDYSDAFAVKDVKVKETAPVETEPETEAPTEPETEAEEEYYEEEEISSDYAPAHVELSDYDRDLLERLVMGEAGTLGYEGCALVAQAVRDSMLLSGTTSVEEIIATYQYDGDTYTEPNETVKEAVSDIFDGDGYAVDHRILYFYACDQVSSDWHEEQQFITECGNVRFFDRW